MSGAPSRELITMPADVRNRLERKHRARRFEVFHATPCWRVGKSMRRFEAYLRALDRTAGRPR